MTMDIPYNEKKKVNFEFTEYYYFGQSGGLNKGTLNLLIK